MSIRGILDATATLALQKWRSTDSSFAEQELIEYTKEGIKYKRQRKSNPLWNLQCIIVLRNIAHAPGMRTWATQ